MSRNYVVGEMVDLSFGCQMAALQTSADSALYACYCRDSETNWQKLASELRAIFLTVYETGFNPSRSPTATVFATFFCMRVALRLTRMHVVS